MASLEGWGSTIELRPQGQFTHAKSTWANCTKHSRSLPPGDISPLEPYPSKAAPGRSGDE